MKTGRVRVVECPAPSCGVQEVLVQNQASVISPGTEKMLIEMGKKSLVGKAPARPDLVSRACRKAWCEGFLGVFHEALARPEELEHSVNGAVSEAGSTLHSAALTTLGAVESLKTRRPMTIRRIGDLR